MLIALLAFKVKGIELVAFIGRGHHMAKCYCPLLEYQSALAFNPHLTMRVEKETPISIKSLQPCLN